MLSISSTAFCMSARSWSAVCSCSKVSPKLVLRGSGGGLEVVSSCNSCGMVLMCVCACCFYSWYDLTLSSENASILVPECGSASSALDPECNGGSARCETNNQNIQQVAERRILGKGNGRVQRWRRERESVSVCVCEREREQSGREGDG